MSNDLCALGRLQNHPAALEVLVLVVELELGDNLLGNLLKVFRRKRENGRAGAGQTHAHEAFLRLGREALDNLGEAGDELLAVRLVDLVLHGEVDEFRVGRGLAQRDGEEGNSLKVECLRGSVRGEPYREVVSQQTYHIRSHVLLRQHGARLGGGHDKLGDNGHGFNLLVPGEFNVVANANRWLGGSLARIDTAGGRGQDFAERDFYSRGVFGLEGHEVGSDKATKQSGADIVRMSLCRLEHMLAKRRLFHKRNRGTKDWAEGHVPIMRQ